MRRIASLLLPPALLLSPVPSTAQVQGDLHVVELESRVFGNARHLRIWTPPGYDVPENRDRRYPVVYLNDGQNLFDAGTALFGDEEWRVDETASAMIGAGRVPPFVVVGIDAAGRRGRAREYLPYPDTFLEPPEPAPLGARYDEFLAQEVLPFVESRYRVARDGAGRVLGGSSYGALVALHVAIERPGLFSRLLLESPSLSVDDDHVLRDAAAANLRLSKVYLGVGTDELGPDGCPSHPGNEEAVAGVERLAEILTAAGLERDRRLWVRIEPCAEHRESAWAARLPGALAFLLGEAEGVYTRVLGLGLDRFPSPVRVHYSRGYGDRAEALQRGARELRSLLIDSLRLEPTEVELIVLDERDWDEVTTLPYGLHTLLKPPPAFLAPARVDRGIYYPDDLPEVEAKLRVDVTGLHYLAHFFAAEALYEEGHEADPPLKWLDELFTLMLQDQLLGAVDPRLLEASRRSEREALDSVDPRVRTLREFDREYRRYFITPEGGANYGWFLARLAGWSRRIRQAHGVGILRDVRSGLGAASEVDAEEGLRLLEALGIDIGGWR